MSDQLVSPKAILDTVLEVQRRGPWPPLEDLENVEPELTSYILETLGNIHTQLQNIGASHEQAKRLHRQMLSLLVVAVNALRKAHFELWQLDHGASASTDADGDGCGPSAR